MAPMMTRILGAGQMIENKVLEEMKVSVSLFLFPETRHLTPNEKMS